MDINTLNFQWKLACRRSLSLSDSVHLPIAPLLLIKMARCRMWIRMARWSLGRMATMSMCYNLRAIWRRCPIAWRCLTLCIAQRKQRKRKNLIESCSGILTTESTILRNYLHWWVPNGIFHSCTLRVRLIDCTNSICKRSMRTRKFFQRLSRSCLDPTVSSDRTSTWRPM